MSRRAHRLRCFALGLAIATAGTSSWAKGPPRGAKPTPPKQEEAPKPDPEADAAADKARGDAALDQKRYEDALAAYEASYAKSPQLAVLYNKGRCLQFLARYAEALGAIEEFAEKAPEALRARVPGLPALLSDLRGRTATLTVSCAPSGARVLVDQKQIGTCPFSAPVRLNAGARVLEAFADGYFPQRRELALPGGGATSVEVRLTSKERDGLLVIKSGVPGAEVALDGRPLGTAPAESGVSPGAHVIVVRRDGHDEARSQVVIGRGERKELSLDPTPRPSIVTRWWFWGGIGVVAAAAATTVVLLTTERSPSNGDFSPGRVTF